MFAIVKAPDQVLSSVAKPVETIDKDVLKFIDGMKETLANTRDPEGVGLAAPQVGKSLQIFIIRQTKEDPFSVFINPQVTFPQDAKDIQYKSKNAKKSGKKLEGCLSLDYVWGEVKRHDKVVVDYLDENGTEHHENFSGFFAIIVQHEYDHLQGILFPRRVLEQKGKLYRSSKDEKGQDVFEPLEI